MTAPRDMTDAELTEAVAREVMGWEIVAIPRRVPGSGETSLTWFDEKRGRRQFIDRDWSPLADANARDEVVERMAFLGWHATMLVAPPAEPDRPRVEFVKFNAGPHGSALRASGLADTLNRAVCEAALEAARSTKTGD